MECRYWGSILDTNSRFVVSTLNRLLAESTVRSSTTFKDWLKLPTPATVRFEPVPVRFSEPVMVSPDFRTLSDAAPVRAAVIVPAAKLPDASRRTAVFAIFVDWNVILPAFQILLPLIVTPSKFATVTLKYQNHRLHYHPMQSWQHYNLLQKVQRI